MNEVGEIFKYAGKTYQLQLIESLGLTTVYRKRKKGLEPVHGVIAFRVVSAYKRKVKGETVARRPRTYARTARRKTF